VSYTALKRKLKNQLIKFVFSLSFHTWTESLDLDATPRHIRISPFLRSTRMQLRGSSRPGRLCRRHGFA